MATETASVRLEKKVDVLIDSVGELKTTSTRLADQISADKRMNEQMISFMQKTIEALQAEVRQDRLEWRNAVGTEKTERESSIKDVRSTLSRIGFALFTALLAMLGSGLAYLVFK